MRLVNTPRAVILAVGGAGLLGAPASADIVGFPIPGWSVNRWDSASASPVNPPSSITLTTGTIGQIRSAFHTTRQSIAQFEAGFTYAFTGAASAPMGAAFVLHNHVDGAAAVARGSGNLGYTDFWGTFNGASAAVSLESGYQSVSSSASGVYTGGAFGGGSGDTAPVVLSSGHAIDVTITYNGFLLGMTARDTVTGSVYAAPLVAIDLQTVLGSNLAYVGFTGTTGTNAGTSQAFSNFYFTSVPVPGSAAVLAIGLLATSPRRRW